MILRWLLAGIYLYAGGTKVFNPVLFQATILSYYNIPEALALVVAILFPWLEIMAGLSLLVNWKTKYSAGFLFSFLCFHPDDFKLQQYSSLRVRMFWF